MIILKINPTKKSWDNDIAPGLPSLYIDICRYMIEAI